jgi:hypothetical protein
MQQRLAQLWQTHQATYMKKTLVQLQFQNSVAKALARENNPTPKGKDK